MSTAFYVAMLAGVTLLMLWSALPPEVRRRYWWPFDFREETPAAEKASPAETEPGPGSAPRGSGGWRARVGLRQASRAGAPVAARRRPGAGGRSG